MDDFAKRTKIWLIDNKKSRKWLSEKSGVSMSTLYAFFSKKGRELSPAYSNALQKAMDDYDMDNPKEGSIPVKIPNDFEAFVLHEAQKMHMSIDTFVTHLLTEHARQMNAKAAQKETSPVPLGKYEPHIPGVPDMSLWNKSINDMTPEERKLALEGPFDRARRERGEEPGILYGKKLPESENDAG